jgi:predicted transposase YbfD/YdcC
MPTQMTPCDLIEYFSDIEDPRVDRQKLHSLPDILFVIFSGVICGVESWSDFVLYGESKLEFLRKYVPLKNGIPSKNTFQRVITRLKPEAFRDCFLKWVSDYEQELGRTIAIDGKALRRSFDKAASRSTTHMVSAFSTEARLVLAQEKVAEKSIEITAIPKIIDMLDVKDSIVTIDAMGCQRDIVEKIVGAGGDYVIALKGNQNTLFQEVSRHFNNPFDMRHCKSVYVSTTKENNRNRLEERTCLITESISELNVKKQWPNIKSCLMIESKRTMDGQQSVEHRYYISSLSADAKLHNKIVRSHWAVENSLHWVMDMVFKEDECRIRSGHGAENMSLIKHIALNKLQTAKSKYGRVVSLKGLRKKAGWDDDTLNTILTTII